MGDHFGWCLRSSYSGVDLNDNTVRLDLDNEPQPDALLRIEVGGSRMNDYIEGAPEFIAEVAASSAACDLHDKKRAYRRNGVQEYQFGKCLSKAGLVPLTRWEIRVATTGCEW